jgi:outer membrane lipoprotein-sorting protein
LLRLHRTLTTIVLAGCVAVVAAQSAPTVDEIVAKNLAAKGGADKLRGVMSVRTTGHAKSARGLTTLTVWTRRPNAMRQEMVSEGRTTITGFDGTKLWAINPMLGPEAREIGGPPAERAREEANDFDSVLLDYKEKGYTVELVASTPGAAPHLRVTKKNGKIQDIYLNPSTFLEERITFQVEQGGKTAIVGTQLSNYKAVDGMMVPFTIRQSINGQLQGEVTYDQVQFNLPLNDDLFKMPVK